ncbi:methyltransferase domain-containing protein [Calothrix sp. NIES-3974]|uniref:methyltransferase domain-containing protein n=1 Tax=Calothrix sp. NIES-3974 TaxID=2005462 RepID=UPI000B5E7964|nr:methyltransferase domain-containing protein [Calothrix sp. NIES-3974]BAZ07913.1 cyclopropane-fatty-acyl-phospholipid synthase [Calothrix sp. NIES-3974]
MNTSLNNRIQNFYDASSGLWEQIWGEHMHHGYYGADGLTKKERRQAQIDLIEELLHWSNPNPVTNLLDVGCGIGGSSLYLAQRYHARATGITLSTVQAQRAQERASEQGLSARTNFLVADALNMPFEDNSFDLVWTLESGEHMPDKVKFLQECYRVLQPGGTLIMATWCHRPTDQSPLNQNEQKLLADIYRVYCLPYVISLPEYTEIATKLPLKDLKIADWSAAVAPFWNVVIDSAFTPQALFGLLRAGWTTIQGALALGLMRQGYESGLIRFGLVCGRK